MKKQNIRVKLTVRSIMLFEELAGKSFNELTPDDFFLLLYAVVATGSPELRLTPDNFGQVLKSESVSKKLIQELQDELKFIEATTPKAEISEEEVETPKTDKVAKIGEMAMSLVINYGLNIEYVMDKMNLWELTFIAKAAEEKTKQDMVDKRFWSYLNIMPHIDSKKAGGPEKFLPFPWEKEAKENKDKEFMKNNAENIMNFFQQQNKDKEDARRNETSPQPGRLCEDNEQAG